MHDIRQSSPDQNLEKVWQTCFGPEFPFRLRLLHQLCQQHPSWKQGICLVAGSPEQPQAFLIGRRFDDECFVDALAVTPEMRRQGLGRRMLMRFAQLHPGLSIRLGGGPSHFVPGLPDTLAENQAFFLRLGFKADWEAHDLKAELGIRPQLFSCCPPQHREQLIAFVAREFPGRWQRDTARRAATEDLQDIVVLYHKGQLCAFCHTFHPESLWLGPSNFWLDGGGIGPVGVGKAYRGLGLGRRLVEESLNYLASRKVKTVGVDWTSISDFYQLFGFEPWRSYRGLKLAEPGPLGKL